MSGRRWVIITLATIVMIIVVSAFLFQGFLHNDAEVVSENTEETISLKWMVYGQKYQASDYVLEVFNEKLQEYLPRVYLELEIVNKSDYQSRWDMKMASAEKLDLAWFGNDVLNYTEEVKKGNLMALDYLLKSDGQEFLEYVDKNLWELEKRDGNIYGIPVYGPLYRANHTLVVNKNVMNRFGNMDEIVETNQKSHYTTKECYEVMEEFLEGAKNHRALGTGVSYQSLRTLADKGFEGIYGVNSPFVIKIYDKKLRVYNKYELDSWRDYFETMSDWYHRGYIQENVASLLDPSSEDGKLKGSVLYVEDYGEKGTVAQEIKPEYEVLRGDLDGYDYISYDGCRNSIVLPKTCSHPEEAMKLVRLLFSDEGKDLYRLLTNGIEKQHYIVTDKNLVARMSDNGNGYLYQLPANAVGNLVQNYETAEGEFEFLIQKNEEAMRSPLEGFDLDVRMISLDMERVNIVVNKYREILSQGTAEDWESLYKEFCSEMKLAGSDNIIEEIQMQLDEFQQKKEQS